MQTTIYLHDVKNITIRRSETPGRQWLNITFDNGPDNITVHAGLERDWTYQDETIKKEAAEAAPIMLKDQAD